MGDNGLRRDLLVVRGDFLISNSDSAAIQLYRLLDLLCVEIIFYNKMTKK
jgi:hypothetical protein